MPRITDPDCPEYEYVTYDDWNPGEGHIQHHAHCCRHPDNKTGYCDCANCHLSKDKEPEHASL
jgi:hypothetical protein